MKRNFNTKPIITIFILSLLMLGNNGFSRNFKDSPYNHRIISFNPGYAFSGRGECFGIGNEISHLKTFTPWFYHRESISSWIIDGSSWLNTGFEHQSGYDFTVELGISPFRMKNQMLSIIGGACISNISMRNPNSVGWWSEGDSYKTIVNYTTINSIDAGLTLGLNYHTRVNSKLWLNARAAARLTEWNVISILSVGIGFNPSKLK